MNITRWHISLFLLSSFFIFYKTSLYSQYKEEETLPCTTNFIGNIRSAIKGKRAVGAYALELNNIKDFIQAIIGREETKLLHKLEYKYGIDIDRLAVLALHDKESGTKKYTISGRVPEPVALRVRQTLAADFDMETLGICLDAENKENEIAESTSDTIILQGKFHEFNLGAQNAIIGHESFHVKYNDSATQSMLYNLIIKDTMDACQEERARALTVYSKFCRFQEIRADVLTCATRYPYAQGIYEAAYHLVSTYGNVTPAHSPSYQARLAVAQGALELYNLKETQDRISCSK